MEAELDNGLNPVGCPYCKRSSEVEALRAELDALAQGEYHGRNPKSGEE